MDKPTTALLSGGAVLTAAALGSSNGPGRPLTALWYSLLRKPDYTPRGSVIGPVWVTLELLLAATGYRLLRAPATPLRDAAVATWGMTLAGLAGYPWLFFRKKRLAASALTSGAMLASATGLAMTARQIDRPAAAMTVPLVLWLGFATLLSEELWRRNPQRSRV